ncbi:GmrSD restriction endonuclease domain-containing protein [Capnocytophaga gingivalis]|uniref:GmrSD restriction endonuclease domain-containing protein n=1 Tax=Capnocytophaga gingivalis TaxID=1017 RepID=UPI003C73F8D8
MKQEKYTFIDVCQQDFDGIEIPIIQRDYAQGREKEEKKRNRFLKALLRAVNSEKGITLDFVYGSVIDKKLVPLDGQQRLTTLFLLHWYAAKRENIPAGQWEVLKKFSYATRPSARRFCEQLLVFVPDFDTEKSLSEQICNEAWFPMAWNDDPTVEGMLRMLDAIHHTFAGTTHLWKTLTEDRKITFYFKKLEDMDITDDIYIKMNSRGKPLTDFEHFKAEFTEAIRETIGNDTISHKIDVAWTNMLWPYRSSNNIIDEQFLNYFHFLTDIIRIKSDDDMGSKKDYFDMIPFYKGNNNNVTFLEKAFDLWEGVNIDEVFNAYLSGEDYETGKVKVYDRQTNLFKDCCENYTGVGVRGSFGFNKMLILYAFIVWKTKATSITDSDFARRIRIIRNLVWNSTDEIRLERMKNLLEEVEEIVINAFLTEESNGFNIRQKREEIEKIDWCNKNPNLTEKLFELEDHWTLYGCIAAVGLENSQNFDAFRALFDNDLLLVSKTLLSYSDYSQTYTDKRYRFIANHNYRNWQEMLHPSKQRKEFEKTKDTIALLLGTLKSLTAADLEKQIQTYLKDVKTLKDWRYYFIKYSSILSYAENGMYYQEEEWQQRYNIEVLRKNSFRGFHWDAILIAIYEETENGELTPDNWGGIFTLKNGMTLENTNEDLIFRDNDEIVHTEKIPQTSEGIDFIDRVEKALELIRAYNKG